MNACTFCASRASRIAKGPATICRPICEGCLLLVMLYAGVSVENFDVADIDALNTALAVVDYLATWESKVAA